MQLSAIYPVIFFYRGILMVLHSVIFEDYRYKNFLPLTHTRAVFELISGFYPIWKRLARYFNILRDFKIAARPYLYPVINYEAGFKIWNPGAEEGRFILINGRLMGFDNGFNKLKNDIGKEEALFMSGDEVVLAVVEYETVKRLGLGAEFFLKPEYPETLKANISRVINLDARLIKYPWDLIDLNGSILKKDYFEVVQNYTSEDYKSSLSLGLDAGAYVLHGSDEKNDIFIGRGSRVMSGSVINAEGGPVYIGDGVTVMPGSVIMGPCYIGNGSLIKAGATIYGETSIGEVCKVGGEVGESIIHGYSNKQHYGFLGHSYIGKWCNLGAGTCTSDLKNNYKNVRVKIEGSERVDTGRMFLGSVIGDYSRIGIGTLLNSGSVIGVMCNIFGGGMVSGNIPSFIWGGSGGYDEYDFDKAIETSSIVMLRRGKELTPEIRELLRYVYLETSKYRKSFLSTDIN